MESRLIAMKRALPVVLLALASAPVVFVYACSNDGGSSGAAPSASAPAPTSTPTTPESRDDAGPADATATDAADGACAFDAPELDGGGLCGARPFGSPAAILSLADAAFEVDGVGAIPPGIYDVTSGDRTTSLPYNWRETLVLDGTSYTQIRRFDTSMGNEGPTNSRSGTYSVDNGEITFVAGCAKNADGGDITAGTNTFRYEIETKGCTVELRMIVAGTLLTFTRR
ncbi:MAG: hypothetical protein KF819_18185 [Labilithrix sp.]|nr:hypothetical protein [Labilithrix sp.]